jgi:hypothetical protein
MSIRPSPLPGGEKYSHRFALPSNGSGLTHAPAIGVGLEKKQAGLDFGPMLHAINDLLNQTREDAKQAR